MKRNLRGILTGTVLAATAALLLTGCATPGPFGGAHYQQSITTQVGPVSDVTVLTLNPEAEQQMLNTEGVVTVGTSQFTIEGTGDFDDMKSQAKAQGKKVGANVVLLSRQLEGTEEKTKTVRVESDSQKAIEELGTGFHVGQRESSSKSSTTYQGNTKTTKSSGSSAGFGVAGTLADVTALIPGQVTYKDMKYSVDVYRFKAVYLRNPAFKGLK